MKAHRTCSVGKISPLCSFDIATHDDSASPSVAQRDVQQSEALALKQDSAVIQSMSGCWQTFCALASPIGRWMPNVPGDSCRAVVIHSPLSDLTRLGKIESELCINVSAAYFL